MARGKKKRGTGSRRIFLATMILMPLIAAAGIGFSYFQMARVERGLLDVCAVQQDAYVNLVLDQINLKENRDNEEIVTRILGSLDASANKYWVFSEEQVMLFVKDVLETNKYKGFTADAYFVTDSAQEFIDSLESNRVIHRSIKLNDKDYVASGVLFSYGGKEYRLCLLTNRSVLLDNNNFLGAKTELWLMILFALGALMVIPMFLAMELWSLEKKRLAQEDALREMSESLVKMNERLANQDLHDTRENLWKREALPEFLESLQKKGVEPVVLMRIHCPGPEERQKFLALSRYLLDRNVLRFEDEGNDLTLLFVGVEHDAAYLNVAPILTREVYVAETRTLDSQPRQAAPADARGERRNGYGDTTVS